MSQLSWKRCIAGIKLNNDTAAHSNGCMCRGENGSSLGVSGRLSPRTALAATGNWACSYAESCQ